MSKSINKKDIEIGILKRFLDAHSFSLKNNGVPAVIEDVPHVLHVLGLGLNSKTKLTLEMLVVLMGDSFLGMNDTAFTALRQENPEIHLEVGDLILSSPDSDEISFLWEDNWLYWDSPGLAIRGVGQSLESSFSRNNIPSFHGDYCTTWYRRHYFSKSKSKGALYLVCREAGFERFHIEKCDVLPARVIAGTLLQAAKNKQYSIKDTKLFKTASKAQGETVAVGFQSQGGSLRLAFSNSEKDPDYNNADCMIGCQII